MLSIIRRLGIGTTIVIVFAVIRAFNSWSHQQSQIPPQPAFADPVFVAMQAQAAPPGPTPAAVLDDRAYVNVVWGRIQKFNDQLTPVADVFDEAAAKGLLEPAAYNAQVSRIAAEIRELHHLANQIRELHPPDRFTDYHQGILEALDTLEQGVMATVTLAQDGKTMEDADQQALYDSMMASAKVLGSYPRTNAAKAGPPAPTP